MSLREYDNKCVRITDIDDNVFEGNCVFNDKEYNEHEYGRNEESLQILNIIFYESYIKNIEVLKELKNNEYGMLEELIVNSDIDFIEDALEMCNEVEKERLMLCIKDNKIKNIKGGE